MRKLNGFMAISAIVMSCSIASASDLYIDNNAPIPGGEISNISINPATGNIFVTTKSGYVVTPSDAEPPPPDAVSIETFSASNLSIPEGTSTSFSWSTKNAVSCAMSHTVDGWNPTIGTSSTGIAVIIPTSGNYIFTLSCSDAAGGSDSSTLNITVTPTVIVPLDACKDYQSPLGGTVVNWSDFWGVDFAGPVTGDKTIFINRAGYVALEFNTGDINDSGAFSTVESTLTSGTRYGSISRCPGDFDVEPECDQVWGAGLPLIWSTEGYNNACDLEKNTTYYFNLTFTNGFDPTTTLCQDRYCQGRIRFYNPE